MTVSPTPHGYPDYGRFSPSTDVILLQVEDLDIDAGETTDLGFIGTLPFIGVRFAPSTGHFRLQFNFYADFARTQLVDGYTIAVRVNQQFRGSVPVLGPFADVSVLPVAVNSAYALTLYAEHRPFRAYGTSTSVGNLLVASFAVNIGAGAVRTDTPTYVSPGWATWSVDTNVADWFSEIEAIDQSGTTTFIDRLEEKAGNQRRTIHLPACSFQVRTGNNTGAAGTFYISVGAHPFGTEV